MANRMPEAIIVEANNTFREDSSVTNHLLKLLIEIIAVGCSKLDDLDKRVGQISIHQRNQKY